MLLLKMKCHLDLPLRCEKVTAKEGEREGEETREADRERKWIKLTDKANQRIWEGEGDGERQRENRGKEGNCRKGGSLVRHYPQSNPQFLGHEEQRERGEKEETQTRLEQLNKTPTSACVLSNFSPPFQLSTSGLFTLAGSGLHAHCRQHRHGSHTISPYTPSMTNPLSPCHRLNSLTYFVLKKDKNINK